MKKLHILTVLMSVSNLVFAQYGGAQLSVGRINLQEMSINNEETRIGTVNTFDISVYGLTDVEDPRYIFGGFGGGVGIRTYKNIPSEMILHSKDPYKTSLTRFDLHVGPLLGVGVYPYVNLVVSPQFGLWYGGWLSGGPKFNGNIALNADLILYRILSVGVTYRATSTTTVSWDGDMGPASKTTYIFFKPALEFRIGIGLWGIDMSDFDWGND